MAFCSENILQADFSLASNMSVTASFNEIISILFQTKFEDVGCLPDVELVELLNAWPPLYPS
jgi:hypothetical protein